MFEKDLVKPKNIKETSKSPKFPETHHRELEKQSGILRAVIFGHNWALSLQLAKSKVMLTLR